MSFLRTILVAILRGYQILLSPILALLFGPMGHGCRFEPTCSQYAIDALSEHGCLKGFWLTLRRVARCHPWGGCGSDPVPKGHHADCPHADSVAVRSTT